MKLRLSFLSFLPVALLLILFAAPAAWAAPHSVSLSWTASTDTVGGYNIYRLNGACPVPFTTAGFVKVNSTVVTGTAFVDSGMAPGNYCYYGTAVANGAESLPSAVAIPPVVILPAAPTGLQATVTF